MTNNLLTTLTLSTDQLAQILWDYNNLNQPLKKSDAIFVLGSHDIRVGEYAADLFLQNYAPLLIVSGNQGRLTKDIWDQPEAQLFARVALDKGVPAKKIIIEDKSTNTGENILFTKKLLEQKNLHIHSIIVVQKPYMGRRAYATFKKIWPEPELIITAPQISYQDYPNPLVPKELVINAMVGDTQRLRIYAQKGFQIPQEIPQNVWQAYKELLNRGYTQHLTS